MRPVRADGVDFRADDGRAPVCVEGAVGVRGFEVVGEEGDAGDLGDGGAGGRERRHVRKIDGGGVVGSKAVSSRGEGADGAVGRC